MPIWNTNGRPTDIRILCALAETASASKGLRLVPRSPTGIQHGGPKKKPLKYTLSKCIYNTVDWVALGLRVDEKQDCGVYLCVYSQHHRTRIYFDPDDLNRL